MDSQGPLPGGGASEAADTDTAQDAAADTVQGEVKSYLQNSNLPLLAGALSLAFVAIRLLSVSGYDPETAYYILQAAGTGAVVVGTLVSMVGLAAAYLAGITLLYHYVVKAESGRSGPFTVTWTAVLTVIACVTAPIFPLLALAAVTIIFLLVLKRADTKKWRLKINLLLLYTLVIVVFGTFITGIWVPAQRISVPGKPPFVGYILSSGPAEFTILVFHPASIIQVASQNTVTGECKPANYLYEQETLGEFISTWLNLPGRVTYPPCPARVSP